MLMFNVLAKHQHVYTGTSDMSIKPIAVDLKSFYVKLILVSLFLPLFHYEHSLKTHLKSRI